MDRETIFCATIDNYLNPVISEYREDPEVTEILINGPHEIYIEREGKMIKTNASFEDAESLLAIARNIAQYTEKRITNNTARFDSRLPDGSRIHVVMPRVSRKGLCISIRKFSRSGLSLEGMVESGVLPLQVKEYLEILVKLGKNIIISGGTGSGKTSFLNALSLKIPDTERIIVIEDTAELRLQQPHLLSFESADPDRYGQGAVTIRDLFHSALRMRPDRIVIGECRGGEAFDLIQAMTSGHGGSMSTLHANNGSDALNRLETMVLMSGITLPLNAVRAQVASAVNVVIQLARMADGRRLITEISELRELSITERYQLNCVYERTESSYKSMGVADDLQHTGNRSVFAEAVRTRGLSAQVDLTGKLFDTGTMMPELKE